MNCDEFRRRLTIDPLSRDPELREHETACAECAPFARDLRADEERLRALLRTVAPPDDGADRVRRAVASAQDTVAGRRWRLGIAAAALIGFGAGTVSLYHAAAVRTNPALVASVVSHIEAEASHLRTERPVPRRRLDYLFRRFGAELTADLGPVRYAAECPMRSRNGVHLVMPGAVGPITVLFMPGEAATDAMPVRTARFEGRIVATAWGSIAVVGERGESIDGIGLRLAAAVRWPQAAEASGLPGLGLVGAPVGTRGDGARQQQDG